MTISKIMRDAKQPYVPHGFRSSFRDWAAELMPNIPDPVAEAALAHAIPDKVISAYKRTAFLEMRRQLLDAWGVYLEGASNVLPLFKASAQ
jgi:integrase